MRRAIQAVMMVAATMPMMGAHHGEMATDAMPCMNELMYVLNFRATPLYRPGGHLR